MCLAMPGKVISVRKDMASVDFKGIQKQVNISLVNVRKGDWVLVHVGFAIQKVDAISARKANKLLEGLA